MTAMIERWIDRDDEGLTWVQVRGGEDEKGKGRKVKRM